MTQAHHPARLLAERVVTGDPVVEVEAMKREQPHPPHELCIGSALNAGRGNP
ncbi:hypothetical protein [Actinomadura mexicana]|uniref:Uncharacterized protein n=1 Tax=Actinomadura mexicana TaxID=134959 RepID=A0A239GQC9_9ACTN|nr:hypothetical protein [Actinomadura mexicana]SNS70713.1 hypothetical protein SAMN06265355_12561 [Actinomadura mexicana]